MSICAVHLFFISWQIFWGRPKWWRVCVVLLNWWEKEHVARLIGLCKNNGAVPCVGIDFHLFMSLYRARSQLAVVRFAWNDISKPHTPLSFHGPWVYSKSGLDRIILWTIMNRNCNTFFCWGENIGGGNFVGRRFLLGRRTRLKTNLIENQTDRLMGGSNRSISSSINLILRQSFFPPHHFFHHPSDFS